MAIIPRERERERKKKREGELYHTIIRYRASHLFTPFPTFHLELTFRNGR